MAGGGGVAAVHRRRAVLRRWGGVALRAAALVAFVGFPFWMAPAGFNHVVFASGLVALLLVVAWLVLRIASRGGPAESTRTEVSGAAPVERRRVTRAQVAGALLALLLGVVAGALLAWSLSAPSSRFALAVAGFATLAAAAAAYYARVSAPRV